jgi:hypothetical protein
MASLKAIVLRDPDPAVDRVERWRVVDLCRVVEQRWGVTYSETGMLRLLWSLDLSHRKTRPVHPQADPRAQEAFKKSASPSVSRRLPRPTPRQRTSRFGARTKLGSVRKGAPAMPGGGAAIPREGSTTSVIARPGSSARCAPSATLA